jgi:hypothetical protein
MATEQIPFLQQVKNTANVTLDIILAGMVSATATAQALASSANSTATSAYAQANGAFNQANSAASAASAAQTTANQGVTNASTAQGTANYGVSLAGTAYNQANNGVNIAQAAYAQANSGVNQAQAAQSTANQGVASSGVSAGSYGSNAAIPVISVDYRGRITSATTTSLRGYTSTYTGVVPAYGSAASTGILSTLGWVDFSVLDTPASSINSVSGGSGYIKMSNGLYLQWGTTSLTTNGTAKSFPTPFPNYCFSMVLGSYQSSSAYYVQNVTKSGYTLYAAASGTYSFFAIGN